MQILTCLYPPSSHHLEEGAGQGGRLEEKPVVRLSKSMPFLINPGLASQKYQLFFED